MTDKVHPWDQNRERAVKPVGEPAQTESTVPVVETPVAPAEEPKAEPQKTGALVDVPAPSKPNGYGKL